MRHVRNLKIANDLAAFELEIALGIERLVWRFDDVLCERADWGGDE